MLYPLLMAEDMQGHFVPLIEMYVNQISVHSACNTHRAYFLVRASPGQRSQIQTQIISHLPARSRNPLSLASTHSMLGFAHVAGGGWP